jgi:uncharacterized membrane protein (UPF0127 family)
MNKKNITSFAVVIALLIGGFFLVHFPTKEHISQDIKYVNIAGKSIKVEVAKTPAEQTRGLSGRSSLATDEGMLFVFEKHGDYFFWMKDMEFPIDIIWLAPFDGDASKAQVIYIKKDARPESYPESYGPAEPSKYILEIVSGFSEENNLQAGDVVEFTY